MPKENEFEYYTEFLRENFPTNVWLKKTKRILAINSLHSVAYDNLLIYEILCEKIQSENFVCQIRFLNDFKEYLNSILIAVPINHIGFIGYLIRSASESLLKFLYSVYFPDKNQETIARTPFRNLKNELKQAYSAKSNLQNEKLSKVFHLYGRYSKEIHSHLTDNNQNIETIDYYLKNYTEKMKSCINDVSLLFELFLILTMDTVSFDFKNLSHASTKRLENQLDPIHLDIIKQDSN